MEALSKYNELFKKLFSLDDGFDTALVRVNETEGWDSVGHMELITQIEDAFGIMLETQDILEFSSYDEGLRILKKYDVEISL